MSVIDRVKSLIENTAVEKKEEAGPVKPSVEKIRYTRKDLRTLRARLIGLAAESRHYKRKSKVGKEPTKWAYDELRRNTKANIRAHHVAYCLLRGVPFEKVESRSITLSLREIESWDYNIFIKAVADVCRTFSRPSQKEFWTDKEVAKMIISPELFPETYTWNKMK